jgi:hypothetical protein
VGDGSLEEKPTGENDEKNGKTEQKKKRVDRETEVWGDN